MKIGIFGGSFNPIHFGHLNLAVRLRELAPLDEIWFIPAVYSPFKAEEPSATIEMRMEMIYLAISDIPHFRLVDIETQRPGPSYTIDTIRELRTSYSGYDFHLLMGEDAMDSFPLWREAEEILKLAPPFVACRPGNGFSTRSENGIVQALKKKVFPMPIMEISSTEIRNRIQKGLYCGHLLPPKVLDFILDNHLY